jgi:hypothetical protein
MGLVSSLPSRPLTDDELYSLHTSEKLVGAVPVNAVSDPDTDRRRSLVVGAIFITESVIKALQYDPQERGWAEVFQGKNAPESEKNYEGIVTAVFDEAEAALEDAAADLEATGDIGEVFDREIVEEGKAAYRDAEEFGKLLQKHYEDAT